MIVWAFRVRQGKEQKFLELYGPEGFWTEFFRGSGSYIRTELARDVIDDRRFLTLDYWKSEEEFIEFHKQSLAGYERLDKECEELTEQETRLGAFELKS